MTNKHITNSGQIVREEDPWLVWSPAEMLPTHPDGDYMIEYVVRFHIDTPGEPMSIIRARAGDVAWIECSMSTVAKYRWADPRVVVRNPHTGEVRHWGDICQDPEGKLIVDDKTAIAHAAMDEMMEMAGKPTVGFPYEAPKQPAMSAPDLLDAAAGHMRDRAKTYDKPGGERSMGKTVDMFNIATGRDMEAYRRIHTELISMKVELKNRDNDPVMLEMVEGLLVIMRDIKPMLRESEGWLLLELLKIVRGETKTEPHRDSLEDEIAYAALKAEARLGGR